MSWEAVAWANKQRLRLPQEQLVLLVLANCADPEGVAFAQWRGREHWWKYLCERTRLSRASIYRHLARIEEIGLAARSIVILADGTKRPIIALDFTAIVDETDKNEPDEAPESESHSETQSHSENESGCQSLTVRLNESHSETPSLDSNICSKDSPRNPPPGGLPARIEIDRFEEFSKAWCDPIPKIDQAQAAWSRLPSDRHGEAIAAAKGYRAWLKAQAKPPTPQSAQSFLRTSVGFAQWLPFVPREDGTAPATARGSYPLPSPEGQAVAWLYTIAGLSDFLRRVMIKLGNVSYPAPMTPRLRTLADLPVWSAESTNSDTRDSWITLNHQQAAAWESFLRETVLARRVPLRAGARAPHPWPPLVGGGWPATGPPVVPEFTDQDAADFR